MTALDFLRARADMNFARYRVAAATAVVSVVLLAGGCAEERPEQKEVVRPVKAVTLGKVEAGARREYPGTIRAFQHADMGFEVPGRIMEFFVVQGDEVVQGEPLARLDARDFESEFNAVEADLRKAQSDLRRGQSIYREDPGAISTATLDTYRKAVEVAQARLEVAQKAVEDTMLRAPFSGRMARKLVEDFANVQAKEPVLVLQDNSTLEIEINVPERDVVLGSGGPRSNLDITERGKPEVVVSALPERKFPASVKEFATTADPVTRTFAVKLTFANPDDVAIFPGMTAKVSVIVDHDQAWSIPATAALADEQGKPYVWKIDQDSMRVSRVPVEVGDLAGNRVRVMEGLAEGEVVAVSGVHYLREGMKVRLLGG